MYYSLKCLINKKKFNYSLLESNSFDLLFFQNKNKINGSYFKFYLTQGVYFDIRLNKKMFSIVNKIVTLIDNQIILENNGKTLLITNTE